VAVAEGGGRSVEEDFTQWPKERCLDPLCLEASVHYCPEVLIPRGLKGGVTGKEEIEQQSETPVSADSATVVDPVQTKPAYRKLKNERMVCHFVRGLWSSRRWRINVDS